MESETQASDQSNLVCTLELTGVRASGSVHELWPVQFKCKDEGAQLASIRFSLS